ncbi:alpha/beta fold hydrolase [Gordonia sp. MP11Mi]|uniref:N-formylmaleamate deformylase n=1 Tax=Gordonia sp. MP11Mi TaxID=3022769 RepID=A0AA97CX19_9ACTN
MPRIVSPECPVLPESIFFRSDALRLHSLRWRGNDGPDVVVVPGITTPAASAGSFAWRLAGLPGVGDVYVLDTRGRGLSEKSPFGTHSSVDYAQDVLALVEHSDLSDPILIGHSMGARVAAQATVQFPGVAQALVAIDPPMSGPGRPPYPIPLDRMVDGVMAARRGEGRVAAATANPRWGAEQVAERGDWLGACDEVALVEAFAHFHLESFEPVWRNITVPTLLLFGDDSPVVSSETAASLRALHPGASVVSVSKSGHMVPMDNPEETVTRIEEFLSALA